MPKCYFCGEKTKLVYEFEYEGQKIRAGLCDKCLEEKYKEKHEEESTEEIAETESEQLEEEMPSPVEVEGNEAWKIASFVSLFVSAILIILSNKKTSDVLEVLEAANKQTLGFVFAVLGGIFAIVYYCSKIANEIKEARCNLYEYIGKRK